MIKRILTGIVAVSAFVLFYRYPQILGLIWFTLIMVILGFRINKRNKYIRFLEQKQKNDQIPPPPPVKNTEEEPRKILTGKDTREAISAEDAIEKIDRIREDSKL